MKIVIIKGDRPALGIRFFEPFSGQSFKGRSGIIATVLEFEKLVQVELDNPIKGFIAGTDQEVHEAHWWFKISDVEELIPI